MPFDSPSIFNINIPNPNDIDIFVVDLFCGASGTTNGIMEACEDLGLRVFGIGINHWDHAIATSRAAHPNLIHVKEDLVALSDQAVSNLIRSIKPDGVIDLLCASPSCTYHSPARGNKPIDEQDRVDPNVVLRWLSAPGITVNSFIVENVPEFQDWGRLDNKGRPDPKHKGVFYKAWLAHVKALGNKVETRVLNAADYGAATSRRRWFAMGARGARSKINWPVESHSEKGSSTLFGETSKWRGAREIINWSLKGQDVYGRKPNGKYKILRPNTLRRLTVGAARHLGPVSEVHMRLLSIEMERSIQRWGDPNPSELPQDVVAAMARAQHAGEIHAEDVRAATVIALRKHDSARTIDDPLTAITASGLHHGLALTMSTQSFGIPRPADQPLATINTTSGAFMVEAASEMSAIAIMRGRSTAQDVVSPIGGISTKGAHHALITSSSQPADFVLTIDHASASPTAKSSDSPATTITGKLRHAVAQADSEDAECFVLEVNNSSGEKRPRGKQEPLTTITSVQGHALAQAANEAFLVPFFGERPGQTPRTHSKDAPLPTVTGHGAGGIAVPEDTDLSFCSPYYRTGTPFSVEEPLHSITCLARHAIATASTTDDVQPDPLLDKLNQARIFIDEHGEIRRAVLLFRMFANEELAAAMGFPPAYPFQGSSERDVTKQIGNAVEKNQAKALCMAQILRMGIKRKAVRKAA
jgi:DNA (cytosine-5)-methyltransferase 1